MFKEYYLVVKKFFALHASRKKDLFNLFFSAMLRSVSKLLIPLVAAAIVEYATREDYRLAGIYVLVFAGVCILYVLCYRYNHWAYTKNSSATLNRLQQMTVDKLATYDENFAKDISTSHIIATATTDLSKLHFVPDRLFDIIAGLIAIVIAVGTLFWIDVWVGIIALAFNLISLMVFSGNMRRYIYQLARQRENQDRIVGLMEQVVDGNKDIKTLGIEREIEKYLEKNKKQWRKAYFKKRRYNDHGWVFSQTIMGIGKIMLYLLMAVLILNGHHNVAVLVLAIGYYENAEREFFKLQDALDDLCNLSTRIDRFTKFLNYQTRNMLTFGSDKTDDIAGKVEFRHVSFTYEKQQTMKNTSFVVSPRSLTAFVGKSGSGKSTVFRLLLRLYKVTSGEILLDDKDIYAYTPEIYASNVAIVTQKPFIFDMSIRENLSLVDANREHQIEACKQAGIHDFIMSLPDGYETKLTQDAENISIGQKQLIALARTLLSQAEVLLFDEVTSALDLNTSKKIMGILNNLKKDHTVLMITHKPQLMQMADDIIVIDHGRLVGRGTHKELNRNNKYYQALQK